MKRPTFRIAHAAGHGPSIASLAAPARRRRAAALLALAAAAVLSACASKPPPPPPPTTIALTLRAVPGLNPDIRGRASPLVVRVYELKSPIAFDRADFVSLYDRDQATLGPEFVAREEFVMKPGESREWNKPAEADTQVIGVLAAYRDLEHARWRAAVRLVPHQRNVLVLRLDADAVTLAPSQP